MLTMERRYDLERAWIEAQLWPLPFGDRLARLVQILERRVEDRRRQEIAERLGLDDIALFMDGFDDCVLGACEQFGRPVVVAYDLEKIIQKLMQDGASREDAEEFWSFNQLGAWLGEGTPVFVTVSRGMIVDGVRRTDER